MKSSVSQNTSKVLQAASSPRSSKLVELERQHHKFEQYSKRECLDIPNSVEPKDLDNFVLRLLQEIGVDLDKLQIVTCHKLGKTDRTIAKFLNRKIIKMCFRIRENWKMLVFLAFFPMVCKIETTWRQGIKTIGGREPCTEKEKFLYHRISARTTGICMV